jgi:hypothetical protein
MALLCVRFVHRTHSLVKLMRVAMIPKIAQLLVGMEVVEDAVADVHAVVVDAVADVVRHVAVHPDLFPQK